MRRFFIQPDSKVSDEVLLSDEESHHITRVLRLSAGEMLQLFDGRGTVYEAEITAVGRRVQLRICSSRYVEDEGVPLRVCQGMLKGKKMEFLLQKCTELGVSEFVPFVSSRCQLKKTEQKRLVGKYDRWRKIIDEACKQCGRARPMQLADILLFPEMLQQAADKRSILFWEEEKEQTIHTASLPAVKDGLQIVLGPEGGFTGEEAEAAEGAGFQILSLGPRILRAETATVAAVSIMQYTLGNI
jgi:16S rRNA (uracil1498-N3)-methyltransferase